MATAITITNVDNTQNRVHVSGTITLTDNYGGGATHGDTLSFLNLDQIKSENPPLRVEIFEAPAAGTSATGYSYSFSPGTGLDNGVLQVFGTGAAAGDPAQEYAEGTAYDAALLAAVIKFEATFQRL